MLKKILYILINSLILTSVFVVLTFIKVDIISNSLKVIILIIANLLYIISVILKWLKLNKTSKVFFVAYLLFSICLFGYILLYKLGVITTISSVYALKEYILSTKEKGVWVYILIQMAQVIILPVPAAIICIVGSLIYGPFLGGLYCSIGILAGSFTSYFIGRTFGYKVVSWIAGKENTEKYSEILRKRGGFFLAIAFLLPMFPDDVLCLIAGITKFNFVKFAIITTITRPIGVICMSYFGSGKLIPFSGWGIYAWIIILILAIIAVIVTYKYQERMENFVIQKIFKRKDKLSKK